MNRKHPYTYTSYFDEIKSKLPYTYTSYFGEIKRKLPYTYTSYFGEILQSLSKGEKDIVVPDLVEVRKKHCGPEGLY